ncbi:MAG TPA: carbohydrate ABC transporter permease [Nitrospirales bacterium]|nr:carbohydrate ABC transporter permease [Nitrospirales bacterium]
MSIALDRRRVARALLLVTIAACCLGPVLWQALTSFKPDAQIVRLPPIWPETATLAHYRTVLLGPASIAAPMLNSAIVASATTALAIALGGLCAFAVARLPLHGGGPVILGITIAIAMFPAIAVISPVYLLARATGLRDTLLLVILVHTTYALPLAIWVLSSVLRQVPVELYWAARVDGCSPWRALRSVILPTAWPGVAVAAVLVFIFSWNEFMFALTLTASDRSRTAPVAIALFPGTHELPWGDMAAAALVVTAPVLLLTLLFQRQIVSGLAAGSVKG